MKMERSCRFAMFCAVIWTCLIFNASNGVKLLVHLPTNSFRVECDAVSEISCGNSSRCLNRLFVCDGRKQCPDGSDEANCTDKMQRPLERWRRSDPDDTKTFVISGDMFQCLTDDSRIVKEFVCDGDTDCMDGSDEISCPAVSHCQSQELLCADGSRCIPEAWRCDGKDDCVDGSDEAICENKTCHESQHLCKSSHECIPKSWRCDGSADCKNGEDEEDCPKKLGPNDPHPCSSVIDWFRCDIENICVPFSKVCDGQKDCSNGKDETDCEKENPCKSNPCSEDQKCTEAPGGRYHCSCLDGFQSTSSGHCLDVNECQLEGEENLCGQECENTHGGYQCRCRSEYRLTSDQVSCEALSGDAILFFAEGTSVRALKLNDHSMTLVQSHLTIPIAVAYDQHDKEVFWSDVSQAAIRSVVVHGPEREPHLVLNEGLVEPEGLAFDWLARNLYVAEASRKCVIACSVDGDKSCATIVHLTGNIRAIVTYPQKGVMFWTDWSDEKPGIERAGLDGSSRRVIISENIRWPNGLALDPVQEMLYWTDGQLKHIERATVDGQKRKIILDGLRHPFSIAVFENKMYWSDWGTHSIEMADKISGKGRVSIVKDKQLPAGLCLYHRLLQRRDEVTNPCDHTNCEHLCLLAPESQYSCACRDGYKLNSDEHSCSVNVTCPSGKRLCPGSAHCVPPSWFCDGQPDCPDEADENDCAEKDLHIPGVPDVISSHVLSTTKVEEGKKIRPCPVDSQFRCPGNDVCIDHIHVCDHVVDCPGGEDENACSYTSRDVATSTMPTRRLSTTERSRHIPISPTSVCTGHTCDEDKVCVASSSGNGYSCECPSGTIKVGSTCEDVDECVNGTDKCSQICDNYYSTYHCECRPGYRLSDDQVTCRVRTGSPKLFYAAHTSIQVLDIKSRNIENIQVQTGLAVGVAYDYVENLVFWTEVDKAHSGGLVKAVYFKDETEKAVTILDDEVAQPEGISVDWINHLIYVTDVGKGRIIACTFSGHKCTTVLHADGALRAIVLHPVLGLMFWTDWGEGRAGIERAGMDGSDQQKIVTKDIAWPNGIALDYTQDMLYWAESKLDRIERCRLDGSGRKLLVVGTDHPFSIAVFENTIYWSDWAKYTIETADKVTAQQRSVLLSGGSNPSGIYLFHPLAQMPYENPCTQDSCEYLCLLGPEKSFRCALPLGQENFGSSNVSHWILPVIIICVILLIILLTLYIAFKRRLLFKLNDFRSATKYALQKPMVFFRKRGLSEKQHIMDAEQETCGRGVLPSMESFDNPVFAEPSDANVEKPLLSVKDDPESPTLHKSSSKKSFSSLPDNDSAIFSITPSRSPSTHSGPTEPYEIAV